MAYFLLKTTWLEVWDLRKLNIFANRGTLMSTDETILFFKIVDPYNLKYMRFSQNVMGGQKYGFIDRPVSK